MKRLGITTLTVSALIFLTATAMAGKSSVEYGKQLFNDPTLGGSTNAKSCNSCHPDGQGLEKSGTRENLSQIINQCITGPLGGTKIDGRTAEMQSLKMYIESLGK